LKDLISFVLFVSIFEVPFNVHEIFECVFF
jgi:hypothetical protein